MTAARAGAALVLGATLLAGCSAGEQPDPTVVVLLVADGASPRGTAATEAFEETVAEACPECDVAVGDAGGDAETQTRQLDDAVADGADVVVLDPVDVAAAASAVGDAEVPVVSLDRPVEGADAHVGIGRGDTGSVVAEAVLGLAGRRPRVLAVTGPAGSPQEEIVDEVVAALGRRATVRRAPAAGQAAAGVDVVVTGDDQTAATVAAATPGVPVTGYGGTLDAVRRVVQGRQALTVYAPWRAEAAAGALVALDLVDVAVSTPSGNPTPTEVDGVPTTLLEPTVVTLPTVTNTVVRQGVFSTEEICAGAVLKRCESLGIR